VVHLTQTPSKIIMMDVVVVDVVVSYGMLSLGSWGTKPGGKLQFDVTYETLQCLEVKIEVYMEETSLHILLVIQIFQIIF